MLNTLNFMIINMTITKSHQHSEHSYSQVHSVSLKVIVHNHMHYYMGYCPGTHAFTLIFLKVEEINA